MLKAVEVISFILHPPVVSCVRECCICKVYTNDPCRAGTRNNKIKAPETFPKMLDLSFRFSIWKNKKKTLKIKYIFGAKLQNFIRR